MNSPLVYIGGKSKLAQTIIQLIPNHKTYCEVFCGAGWVFFRKEKSPYEIINDLDGDLVTFYRVLQHHLEEFLKQFKWILSSREFFDDWKTQLESDGLTDIQRAARYYYLQRHGFAGHVKQRTFGVAATKKPRINLLRLEEELSEVYLRFTNVVIEKLKWQDLVRRYDREETFFYLDPPYFRAPYYNFNMELPDYLDMAHILSLINGKFLLSLNDCSEIREIFKSFNINPVVLKYSASKGKMIEGKELLISNY